MLDSRNDSLPADATVLSTCPLCGAPSGLACEDPAGRPCLPHAGRGDCAGFSSLVELQSFEIGSTRFRVERVTSP